MIAIAFFIAFLAIDEYWEVYGFAEKLGLAMFLLFGFFMAGWTKRKQALHDNIAGTLVVRK